MSLDHCVEEVTKVLKRKLKKTELDELTKRLNNRRANPRGDTPDEAIMKEAAAFGEQKRVEALLKRRNAIIDMRRRLEMADFLKRAWPNEPHLGVEAILVGVNRVDAGVGGTRFSVAAQQKALAHNYSQGFTADVYEAGLWSEFKRDIYNDEIAEALHRNLEGDLSDLNPNAVKLAKIFDKWQEVARVDANKAGAFISKLKGRIVEQTHRSVWLGRATKRLGGTFVRDGDKGTANRDAWVAWVRERLDPDRTFDGMDAAEQLAFLNSTYDALASGVHLGYLHSPKSAARGIQMPANVARAMSQQRLLHFKDAKSWLEYNKMFGAGNLRETIMQSLQTSAHKTGLMRVLGPSAETNFNNMLDDARNLVIKNGNDRLRTKFESRARQSFQWFFKEVSGVMNHPANEAVARYAGVLRAIESMTKLGGAVISAVADLPIALTNLKFQGVGLTDRWGIALNSFTNGVGSAERRQFLSILSVQMDGMRGAAASRFDVRDNLPGLTSAAMNQFFKWNGLTWWTDTMRANVAMGFSHQLALNSNKRMSSLPKGMQTALKQYGVTPEVWDIMRKNGIVKVEGKKMFSPEAARDIDDATLDAFIAREGRKPSPAKRAELRAELEQKFKSYFADQSDFSVVTPDARIRALMMAGQEPGTAMGEAVRFLMQFKAFPMAVLEKPIGRELFSRGANTSNPFKAIFHGNGELQGMASFVVGTTIAGYIAGALKDLVKGREPRTPDTPKEAAKVVMASMLQGGGLGILGDFLFGEWRTRFGGNIVTGSLGPFAGTLGDVADLAATGIDTLAGDRDAEDLAAKSIRVGQGKIPFINLFYLKWALDYMIIWRWQEYLNPGFARRTERRLKRENDQQYLLGPVDANR